MNKNKIYLHIGFGRTSTTTLQNLIFPNLVSMKNIDFVQGKSFRLKYNLTSEEDTLLKYKEIIDEKNFSSKDLFISDEGLISLFSETWSPHNYHESFDIIKKNFDKSTEILITIRKPSDWLRSIFSIFSKVSIKDFFLLKKDFDIKNHTNTRFLIENFNYEKVINLYSSYFDNVYVIKYENISSFKFMKCIFCLDDEQIIKLKNIYKMNKMKSGYGYYGFKVNKFLTSEKRNFFIKKLSKIRGKKKIIDFLTSIFFLEKKINIINDYKDVDIKYLDKIYESIDEKY